MLSAHLIAETDICPQVTDNGGSDFAKSNSLSYDNFIDSVNTTALYCWPGPHTNDSVVIPWPLLGTCYNTSASQFIITLPASWVCYSEYSLTIC